MRQNMHSTSPVTPYHPRHLLQPAPSSVSVACPAIPMPMAASASSASSFWQGWFLQFAQKPHRALLPSLHSMLKPGLTNKVYNRSASSSGNKGSKEEHVDMCSPASAWGNPGTCLPGGRSCSECHPCPPFRLECTRR